MPRFWLSINRVEALTDGIFAISMTLLVLSIDVPKVSGDDANTELMGILSDNLHQFEHYVLSFLLLAMFWLIHARRYATSRRSRFLKPFCHAASLKTANTPDGYRSGSRRYCAYQGQLKEGAQCPG